MPSSVMPPIPETEVPTWKSPNELIHERINFDDTIWGFGLAGGAYYKTPLRITYVKPGSRAQMAHIYPGDVVLRLNGIETSSLTLEEAHKIILESGIHLKINVTSPEDLEDNYYCYQDPLELAQLEELKAKENKQKAIPRHPKVLGKSSHWSLQWPWKSKRKIIYKESNCYLVPSKFEEKHKDTRKPEVKQDDMIVLDSIHNVKKKEKTAEKNVTKNEENKLETSRSKHNIPESNADATEQINSIVKDDEKPSTIEQNGPVDIKKEENFVDEENTAEKENHSVDENNENIVTDQDSAVHENEEDTSIEQNNEVVNSNEDIIAEENKSIDETQENLAIEPNNLVDENTEERTAEENHDERNALDENKIVNNHIEDNEAAQNSSEEMNNEQNSVKLIDSTDLNKAIDDNIKFENGDIPVNMNEPENSR